MAGNLILRVIVAVIGIPALVFICLQGGYYLLAFCVLLVGVGGYELGAMTRQRGYRTRMFFSVLIPIIFVLAAFYGYDLLNVVIASLFIHVILIIFDYSIISEADLGQFLGEMFARLLPVFYLGLLASYIILLDKISELGGLLLIFAFVVTWTIDTFAYFGGKSFGKHKLSPVLSPGKTREGFVFGLLGAVLAGILCKMTFLDLEWSKVIVMSIVSGLIGQIGDLFESAIKRHCKVKDSSNILPGHGGILDRFDSFLFTMPVIYLILVYWK